MTIPMLSFSDRYEGESTDILIYLHSKSAHYQLYNAAVLNGCNKSFEHFQGISHKVRKDSKLHPLKVMCSDL